MSEISFFNVLMIATAGAIGGLLRYFLTVLGNRVSLENFPAGTFMANLLACFLWGALIPVFSAQGSENTPLKIALFAGGLGSLSTFSTLMGELVKMLKEKRARNASVYLFFSVTSGFGTLFLGSVAGHFFISD